MNNLFLWSKLRSLNYIDYVSFRNRYKHDYERTGEYSAAIIMLLVVFFRLWNTHIEPFMLPEWYLGLISLLLFQKIAVFILKIALIVPVLIIATMYQCCISNRCRCSRKREPKESQDEASSPATELSEPHGGLRPMHFDWRTNFGFDTYEEKSVFDDDDSSN